MQRQKQKKKESGFTFIELMVSMVIASFVFAGIYGVYTIQQRSYTVQEQVSEMQQKGRAALDFMVRDIRMAGYNDPDGNCTSRGTSNWNNWVASPTTFAFDTCVPGATTSTTVQYTLYDAYSLGIMDDVGRSVNGGNNQLIVEGLDGLEFYYTLENATTPGTYDAPVTSVTGVNNLRRIRSVQISILVRSTFPDIKYTEKSQYIPASGATNWGDISKNANQSLLLLPWYNYHRRLLVTSVKMRNMGL